MKILHTSDWHIGQNLHRFDRRDEHRHLMQQLCDVVKEHRPDVFLLCGDIFDTAQPSASSTRLFVEGMLEIRKVNPDMKIVAIAGNHDSGAGHESHSELWRAVGCEMIGTLNGSSNPEDYLVEIPGKGWVAAVPYASSRNRSADFFGNVGEAIARRNNDNRPAVLMTHLTVKGVDATGHDSRGDIIGGIEGIADSAFGDYFDYVALGHIHRRQNPGGGVCHYSGSPLAISFDEEFNHGAYIVEIPGHGEEYSQEFIALEPLRPLISIPSRPAPFEEAMKRLEELTVDKRCYLRLNVEVADYLPYGARDKAIALAEEKGLDLCLINATRGVNDADRRHNSMTVAEFKQSNPVEIARKFFENTGREFPDSLAEMIENLSKSSE